MSKRNTNQLNQLTKQPKLDYCFGKNIIDGNLHTNAFRFLKMKVVLAFDLKIAHDPMDLIFPGPRSSNSSNANPANQNSDVELIVRATGNLNIEIETTQVTATITSSSSTSTIANISLSLNQIATSSGTNVIPSDISPKGSTKLEHRLEEYKFPKQSDGRSFQFKWLNAYQWLEYSSKKMLHTVSRVVSLPLRIQVMFFVLTDINFGRKHSPKDRVSKTMRRATHI
ncbi:uncharacterized protein [Eurosta solidaginis]|uniref:uncharacterized protein isoform X2 n=1 Tax=Eurosta solidaginis TaxID=178769 RepID=UPI003530BDD2